MKMKKIIILITTLFRKNLKQNKINNSGIKTVSDAKNRW